MTSDFIRNDQDQQHLLLKDLSEWVAKGSLERFVSDTTDYLDEQDRLEPFYPEETDESTPGPAIHQIRDVSRTPFSTNWEFVTFESVKTSNNLYNKTAELSRVLK